MEKRYFVLKKGYLNIDADFFYFSDHGNWETCEVLEETEVPQLTFFYVSRRVIQTVYTILVIAFLSLIISNQIYSSGAILLIGAFIHLLDYRYKAGYLKFQFRRFNKSF